MTKSRGRNRFGRAWLGLRDSPLSTADFTVVDGRISLRQADSVEDPKVMFRLFELVARHDLKLTAETENAVEAALAAASRKWNSTTSGSVGVFPQDSGVAACGVFACARCTASACWICSSRNFRLIDSLVIRDYYHRYTVDEHSLVTIENLHNLASKRGDTEPPVSRHSSLRSIIRSCCICRCCFTMSARACPTRATWRAAWKRCKGVFERLRLDSFGRETVTFLIANHLRMSATLLRRDIFDPEAVHDFAQDRRDHRASQDADAFHLRGHQGRESGSADDLEGGDAVATLRRHGKLSESLRGRSAHVSGREKTPSSSSA